MMINHIAAAILSLSVPSAVQHRTFEEHVQHRTLEEVFPGHKGFVDRLDASIRAAMKDDFRTTNHPLADRRVLQGSTDFDQMKTMCSNAAMKQAMITGLQGSVDAMPAGSTMTAEGMVNCICSDAFTAAAFTSLSSDDDSQVADGMAAMCTPDCKPLMEMQYAAVAQLASADGGTDVTSLFNNMLDCMCDSPSAMDMLTKAMGGGRRKLADDAHAGHDHGGGADDEHSSASDGPTSEQLEVLCQTDSCIKFLGSMNAVAGASGGAALTCPPAPSASAEKYETKLQFKAAGEIADYTDAKIAKVKYALASKLIVPVSKV